MAKNSWAGSNSSIIGPHAVSYYLAACNADAV